MAREVRAIVTIVPQALSLTTRFSPISHCITIKPSTNTILAIGSPPVVELDISVATVVVKASTNRLGTVVGGGQEGRLLRLHHRRFDYRETLVIERQGRGGRAEEVARALGVSNVIIQRVEGSPYDATVIIGKDYKPGRPQ